MNDKKITQFNPVKDKLDFEFSYNKEETDSLHSLLNGNSNLSIDDLRRVSLWKTNRVLGVSEETIEQLSELAAKTDISIDDPFVEEVMEDLVDSQGIGYPMASAILKFINPNVFPIIDVRAYRALTGKKITDSMYSFGIYKDYTKELMKIAKQNQELSLRDIDEQLYCFDKDRNGTI